eukprot:TRINITY_DN12156_c1_g1_i2.p1 TRINITY_DN12156_c1_g1~~TRINITY_DN12156_c1_g1_i2.p1  ORF type:complete len:278 (+),score=41.42 TRINITY_DN12156_c1_g1_i2:90-923(+)
MDHMVAAGTAASVAEVCTMPIDTTKVRLQLKREGFGRALPTAKQIIIKEGWKSLFRGCTPAITRQGLYSGVVFGLYHGSGLKKDTFTEKLLLGGAMGGLVVAIVNPFDVVKVRMQSGNYGYSGMIDALTSIASKEGIRGLTAGVSPAMQRAFVVNAAELGTYDQSKQILAPYFDALPAVCLHFSASVIAGAVSVMASNPFDVAKTRLMSSGGSTSLLSCLVSTVKEEGVLALYKGSFPNWMRKGPHCTIQFILYEQIKSQYQSYQLYRQNLADVVGA